MVAKGGYSWDMRAMRVIAGFLVLSLAGCGLTPAPTDEPANKSTADATNRSAKRGDVVTRSLDDVQRYWTGEFPEISGGKKFQPVEGGFHPYTKSSPPLECGGQQAGYQPNAFYCPDGDYIAWDAQVLIPQLQEQFGPLLVGVVMAHEYGHAVQTRLGNTDQATVVLEQQADCFAGSWLADVQAGHSTAFEKPTAEQLDNTVAGILMLRDQPGTPAVAEGAHGNAFDRIRAFQEGVPGSDEMRVLQRGKPAGHRGAVQHRAGGGERRGSSVRGRGEPARPGRPELLDADLPGDRRRPAVAGGAGGGRELGAGL